MTLSWPHKKTRGVANGLMRMEASSYTSTSVVTRRSSCPAFPCRALPDQKCLLSSYIANSFINIRSEVLEERWRAFLRRLTLTIRLFLLHVTQQLCKAYQGCKVLIQTCTVPLPPRRQKKIQGILVWRYQQSQGLQIVSTNWFKKFGAYYISKHTKH
jgi:hypothetical protein